MLDPAVRGTTATSQVSKLTRRLSDLIKTIRHNTETRCCSAPPQVTSCHPAVGATSTAPQATRRDPANGGASRSPQIPWPDPAPGRPNTSPKVTQRASDRQKPHAPPRTPQLDAARRRTRTIPSAPKHDHAPTKPSTGASRTPLPPGRSSAVSETPRAALPTTPGPPPQDPPEYCSPVRRTTRPQTVLAAPEPAETTQQKERQPRARVATLWQSAWMEELAKAEDFENFDTLMDNCLVKAIAPRLGEISVNCTIPGTDTQLRPDVVITNEAQKKIILVNVTVSFENRTPAFREA
nr:predicted GPI-anchored protein 58 [Chrysemys picta bellii]